MYFNKLLTDKSVRTKPFAFQWALDFDKMSEIHTFEMTFDAKLVEHEIKVQGWQADLTKNEEAKRAEQNRKLNEWQTLSPTGMNRNKSLKSVRFS